MSKPRLVTHLPRHDWIAVRRFTPELAEPGPPTLHDHASIALYLGGRARFWMQGLCVLGPGDLLLIPDTTPHYLVEASGAQSIGVSLCLSCAPTAVRDHQEDRRYMVVACGAHDVRGDVDPTWGRRMMPNGRLCRAIRVHPAAALRVTALAALAAAMVTAPLSAQRMGSWSHPAPWSLMLVGGGSYSLSDLEIVSGTDQNGGWSWDAGLRLQRGRGSIGVGFERTRFDLGPDGAATPSGIYVEPRLTLGRGIGLRPYVFLHGARIFDYDVDFCCSAYPTFQDADGWSYGAGFGLTTAPVGFVRFDLSASVSRLSGESDVVNFESWKGAGPLVAIRLGASVPLIGGR